MIDEDFMYNPVKVPVYCSRCGFSHVARVSSDFEIVQPLGISEGDDCPGCGEPMRGEAM